jgi:hypothetical protein
MGEEGALVAHSYPRMCIGRLRRANAWMTGCHASYARVRVDAVRGGVYQNDMQQKGKRGKVQSKIGIIYISIALSSSPGVLAVGSGVRFYRIQYDLSRLPQRRLHVDRKTA